MQLLVFLSYCLSALPCLHRPIAICNGNTDMQFIDLALKGSGHDPFAQPFDTVHLGFDQTAPVITTPHIPYPSAQTSACGDSRIAVHKGITFAYSCVLSRGNDGNGTSLDGRFIDRLGVIGAKLRSIKEQLLN